MTTKLQLYKRAVLHCKQTPPASLTENIEARRLCDVHYDDVLEWMLESGFWTHAMRTVKITENTGVTPDFGYSHAHDVPVDFVRRRIVSASEFLEPPLDYMDGGNAYLIEQNYIWADVTPIYLQYVSNDASFGLDLTKWTDRLAEAASLELARRICKKITGSDSLRDSLGEMADKELSKANTFDALQQPTKAQRTGRWAGNRFGRRFQDYRRA